MNIVDTSGWLAFFNGEKNADVFAEPIRESQELLVPTICIYEVFKFVKSKVGEVEAVRIVAQLKQGRVVELNEKTALEAADISIRHKLAMADSIIYATALIEDAVIWTQDADFKELRGVKYFVKQ
ncbi:MAG: type II toxin-antitoxin system VapC family toxin [Desulfatitalea sp.]